MAHDGEDSRTRAEKLISKAQRTTEVATAQIEAERTAVRAKSARLKALRLAHEAANAEAEAARPPAAEKAARSLSAC